MKRSAATLSVLVVFVAGALGQAVVLAENRGYAWDSAYNELYDARTVITFRGEVSGIQVAPPMSGMGKAVTLLVETPNGGTAIVDVGPQWYIQNQKAKIGMHDQVKVTGSKVMIDGHGVILAEQIVQDGLVLTLRRPNGRPYWDASGLAAGPTPVVTGTIKRIATISDPRYGLMERILVQTQDGDVWLVLAPDWFMGRQSYNPALGDVVGATTYPVLGRDHAMTSIGNFAGTLWSGSNWMILRNIDGRPVWVAFDNH